MVCVHLLEILCPYKKRIDKAVRLRGLEGLRTEVVVHRRRKPLLRPSIQTHMAVCPGVLRGRVILHVVGLERAVFVADHDVTVGDVGLRGLIERHILGVNS